MLGVSSLPAHPVSATFPMVRRSRCDCRYVPVREPTRFLPVVASHRHREADEGRRPHRQGHRQVPGVSRTTLDASEDLPAQILNNPDLSQKLLDELVPIIYKGLKATAYMHNWGLSCRRSVNSFPAAVLVELRIA